MTSESSVIFNQLISGFRPYQVVKIYRRSRDLSPSLHPVLAEIVSESSVIYNRVTHLIAPEEI
jgi:hypothetical protein